MELTPILKERMVRKPNSAERSNTVLRSVRAGQDIKRMSTPIIPKSCHAGSAAKYARNAACDSLIVVLETDHSVKTIKGQSNCQSHLHLCVQAEIARIRLT